ncbi:MAG: hypothetical protein FJ035_00715 [Chloroflexi bacterium]|nr:hypothetical protein [Chloroflexota bacterium]
METERSEPRSTWRVLLMLVLAGALGAIAVSVCIAAYVGSSPGRVLTVRISELEVGTARFYPLPSEGADGSGRTYGVWVRLEDDDTASAFLAKDPYDGCTVPWRPELRFEGHSGVFRSPCHGAAYDRAGNYVGGLAQAQRGLDRFHAAANEREITVDLGRVELGPCTSGATTPCSRQGAPVLRTKPPASQLQGGP